MFWIAMLSMLTATLVILALLVLGLVVMIRHIGGYVEDQMLDNSPECGEETGK